MARGKTSFERSRAEKKFTQALKADKKVVLEKKKVKKKKFLNLFYGNLKRKIFQLLIQKLVLIRLT